MKEERKEGKKRRYPHYVPFLSSILTLLLTLDTRLLPPTRLTLLYVRNRLKVGAEKKRRRRRRRRRRRKSIFCLSIP